MYCQRFLNICQSGGISPNLVTLFRMKILCQNMKSLKSCIEAYMRLCFDWLQVLKVCLESVRIRRWDVAGYNPRTGSSELPSNGSAQFWRLRWGDFLHLKIFSTIYFSKESNSLLFKSLNLIWTVWSFCCRKRPLCKCTSDLQNLMLTFLELIKQKYPPRLWGRPASNSYPNGCHIKKVVSLLKVVGLNYTIPAKNDSKLNFHWSYLTRIDDVWIRWCRLRLSKKEYEK